MDEKRNLQKSLENFFGNFEKIHQKMAKKELCEENFSENLRNHALLFCGLGRKRQFIGNFEKIFANFQKIS